MKLRIVCQVVAEESGVSFTWSEGADSFEPYRLSGANRLLDFRESASQARKALQELVQAHQEIDAGDAHDCLFALAQHGYSLHEAIFAGASEQIRTWLAEVHGNIESLEIVVDAKSTRAYEYINIPWNVVYRVPPERRAFTDAVAAADASRHFWGRTYNLAIGVRADPLRRKPWLDKPRLLFVVDTAIAQGLADAARKRFEDFIQRHRPAQAHSLQELIDQLKHRPDIVYWFSHATPELLYLGDDRLSAHALYRTLLMPGSAGRRGLAFLNACQTGQVVSGEGAYLTAVTDCGMSGIVGTEQQTIDNHANAFGLEFLERFIRGEAPIAELMRDLRGRHPLGLLYSTFCPPHIAAAKPAPDEQAAAVAVAAGEGAAEVRADLVPGEVLGVESPPALAGQLLPLPPLPYVALGAYRKSQRALFAGRRDDCDRFVAVLNAPSTRLVVLQGASGVGKTSFLQAEVIPFLEEVSIGYRFLRDRDEGKASGILMIRAGKDLVAELAHALWSFSATPYTFRRPTGEPVQRDLRAIMRVETTAANAIELAGAMGEEPELLHRLLKALAAALPFALVMIIDQAEEIFTQRKKSAETDQQASTPPQAATTEEDAAQGQQTEAIRVLQKIGEASEGDYKLIVSLRTEYYGRLVDVLRSSRHSLEAVREYLLTDFDLASLCDAIERPTLAEPIAYSTEIPREKYRFFYSAGLAHTIAREVQAYANRNQDSLLPLIQVICTQLYAQIERSDGIREITAQHLANIGGVSGGMVMHVEGLLRHLLPAVEDQSAMKHLLTRLYAEHPDGALTTALVPESELRQAWKGKLSYAEAIRIVSEPDYRLIRRIALNQGSETATPYLSLGHDSLARVARDWFRQAKKHEDAQKRWRRYLSALAAAVAIMAVLTVFLLIYQRQAADISFANRKLESSLLETEVARKSLSEALRLDVFHKAAAKAQLLETTRPDIAVLLAAETNASVDDLETRSALMNVLESEPRLETLLSGHRGGICATAYSQDATLIVTVGCYGSLKIWDSATRKLLRQWEIAPGPYDGIAVLRGNRQLSVAFPDGLAKIWDMATGDLAADCRFAESPDTADPDYRRNPVAFTLDGTRVASSDKAGLVTLTRIPECVKAGTIKFPSAGTLMAFSSDGSRLALSGKSAALAIADVGSGKPPVDVTPPLLDSLFDLPVGLSLSEDGNNFAQSLLSGEIWVQYGNGVQKVIYSGRDGARAVDFNVRSWLVAAANSSDGLISLWSGEYLRHLRALTGHSTSVEHLVTSPDGKTLLSAGADDYAALWNAEETCRLCVDLPADVRAMSVALGPQGQLIYMKHPGMEKILSGDVQAETVLAVHDGTGVRDLLTFPRDSAVLAAGDTAVVVGEFGHIARYGLPAGNALGKSPEFGKNDFALSSVVSRDTSVVAYAHGGFGTKTKVDIWRDDIRTVARDFDEVVTLHLSPDGRQLIVVEQSGDVSFWNTAEPDTPLRVLSGRSANRVCKSALVSHDGKLLVEGGENRIRLWDLDHERQIGVTMTELSGNSYEFAFSRDNQTLAAATIDGTIRLWDIGSQQALGPLLRTANAVAWLEFGPDGRLFTMDSDGGLKIWNFDPASMREQARRMVTRNLTREEWTQYFGEEPYRETFEDPSGLSSAK